MDKRSIELNSLSRDGHSVLSLRQLSFVVRYYRQLCVFLLTEDVFVCVLDR